MTLAVVAIAWCSASLVSGLFVGNVLHRYGAEVGARWDPVGPLDGAVLTSIEPRSSNRIRHTSQ